MEPKPDDLQALGYALLKSMQGTILMRHATPINTLSYGGYPETTPARIVWDFVSWCNGNEQSEERLRSMINSMMADGLLNG